MNETIKREVRQAAILFVKLTALAALAWFGAYPFEWVAEHVWEGFYPLGLTFLLAVAAMMVWLMWRYFTRPVED